MNMRLFVVVLLGVFCIGIATAQVPLSPPLSVDLGVGGGLSLPTGKLADSSNTGYHVGGKIRLSSFMPLSVVGSVNYNRIPIKNTDIAATQWMLGAGLEYPIPSVVVKPYFGADVLLNSFSSTVSGSSSYTRIGMGIGGGIEFGVPAFGSFDAQVKYHIMNLTGKQPGEETINQITANLSLMFSLL